MPSHPLLSRFFMHTPICFCWTPDFGRTTSNRISRLPTTVGANMLDELYTVSINQIFTRGVAVLIDLKSAPQ